MKESLKNKLGTPGRKRWVNIALLVGVILVVMWGADKLISKDDTQKKGKTEVVRNVLTDTDTRQLGIDGLSAQVTRMRREVSELTDEFRRYVQTKDSESKRQREALDKDLTTIKQQIKLLDTEGKNATSRLEQDIKRSREQGGKQAKSSGDSHRTTSSSGSGSVRDGMEALAGTSTRPKTDPFRDPDGRRLVDPQYQEEEEEDESRPAQATREKRKPLKINTINSAVPEKKSSFSRDRSSKKEKQKEIEFYMPTGSIISAILINGLDASTAQGAKSEPMPALLRVEKDAILPNRFSSDIKDCFILASGHGDLSSERAFLRGEYLSCVRNDGGVLETKFPSYVVGEDGKAGMRGRLVSKQGQVIARTLIAGFASGVSKAFDVTPVSVLDTTSVGGSVQYQSNFDPALVQGAAAQGASRALEKVADFYLKMAEQMFPVVEITAGRRINVIITAGTKLRLENVNELADANKSVPTQVSTKSQGTNK